jgi:hypothetical protein
VCSTVPIEQLPENDDGHFPNYWTKDQWRDKLNTYEWLTFNRGGLGCSTCKSVGKLGPMKTQGLKLANEWVEGSVEKYGDTNKKKIQSGKRFLAINLQLHILKCVKQLLLLRKNNGNIERKIRS